MRKEVWVASPEPAVGVFTTAGTCQGACGVTRDRLRRPLTEPVCRMVRQQSGSGEGREGQGAVTVPGRPWRWGTGPAADKQFANS